MKNMLRKLRRLMLKLTDRDKYESLMAFHPDRINKLEKHMELLLKDQQRLL
ncbi:MAG: hypothetical protein GY861_03315 [bacterium]|nr:hypothetical protein [bacterium]